MRKYHDILVSTTTIPQEPDDSMIKSIEKTMARLAREKEIKIKKNLGYMELLMAMAENIGFAIVHKARTDEFPGGNFAKL